MDDDLKIRWLRRWWREEYDRRTKLIESGHGRIDWMDPGTRVSWSEIWAKAQELGIDRSPAQLRPHFRTLPRKTC